MNKKAVKRFAFILVLLVLCSGCGKSEKTEQPASKQEVIKYRSGTIMFKTNDKYDATEEQEIIDDKTDNIEFGPETPGFGENHFKTAG